MLAQNRILLIFVAGAMLFWQAAFGQVQGPDNRLTEEVLSKQLKINRDALLTGSGEIRVDAASEMLVDTDLQAREVLLGIISQSGNNDARLAICKAISQSRGGSYEIRSKQDFIEPLIEILTTEEGNLASQAGEAILAYDYRQVADKLEYKASDKTLPVQARLNVIYALKLQPDVRAIYKLLELVDDTNNTISNAAAETLTILGIPSGADSGDRRLIKKELEQKGRNAFLLDRIRWLDDQKRKLEAERALWRQKFIQASERIYNEISNFEARGKFLATEYLTSQDQFLKTWGLSKVEEWLKGTNSQVPGYIGELLLKLISDSSKEIRIKSAGLLPWFMDELDSAGPLIEQIKVETDDNARLELFIALGSACRYASLPISKITITGEIKKQTLDWAVEYLYNPEIKKVKSGSEVIKKLLEQNGLIEEEAGGYLAALEDRYKLETSEGNPEIRSYLLNVMAAICNRQAYHAQAVGRFMNLFEEALNDDTASVREAAVEGWICVDEKRALQQLRKDFINDSSPIVRKKMIDLAGLVGGENDLEWLSQKLIVPIESQASWKAVIKILGDSNAVTVSKWIDTIEQLGQGVAGNSNMLGLLQMAEQKSETEKKDDLLLRARFKIAKFYSQTGVYDKAAEYMGVLIKTSGSEVRDQYTADLLEIYLRWSNFDAVGNLISNQLLHNDVQPSSFMAMSLERYLSDANSVSDPNSVVTSLAETTSQINERPAWQGLLNGWKERFCSASVTDPNSGP